MVLFAIKAIANVIFCWVMVLQVEFRTINFLSVCCWVHLVPDGSILFQMVQLVPGGSRLFQVVLARCRWLQLVPVYSSF